MRSCCKEFEVPYCSSIFLTRQECNAVITSDKELQEGDILRLNTDGPLPASNDLFVFPFGALKTPSTSVRNGNPLPISNRNTTIPCLRSSSPTGKKSPYKLSVRPKTGHSDERKHSGPLTEKKYEEFLLLHFNIYI